MLRSIATILLLTLTLGMSAYGSPVLWQDHQQHPNRLKENPGKSDQQQQNPSNINEEEAEVTNNVPSEAEEVEVKPKSIDKSESVNKYNFIFYFLYKFKYEDSKDDNAMSALY